MPRCTKAERDILLASVYALGYRGYVTGPLQQCCECERDVRLQDIVAWSRTGAIWCRECM